jgi:hypothetical protein
VIVCGALAEHSDLTRELADSHAEATDLLRRLSQVPGRRLGPSRGWQWYAEQLPM